MKNKTKCVVIFGLILLISGVVSTAGAVPTAGGTVVSYDFNSLSGNDTPHFTNLDGQDNWTSIGFRRDNPIPGWYVGVTQTLGFDGTPALRFQRTGSGVGADASRLNDGSFSIPDFNDADVGFFQVDFGIGCWGEDFALAYDANSDGVIRKTDPSEIGPRLRVGNETRAQISVISADDVTTKVPLANANGAVGGDWVRLRLVMDFTANGGQGSGSVYYQNLAAGDTAFQPLAGLQNVNLGLDPHANNARNPAHWNAMWLHMEGATNQLDNIVIGVSTDVTIKPDTLNKKSKGKWVTVYTELPAGYNVTDINVSTMMLNEIVPAELQPTEIGDYDSDGIPDLMAKFDRQAVINMLPVGDAVSLTVTGKLYDGTPFEGIYTIRVIA